MILLVLIGSIFISGARSHVRLLDKDAQSLANILIPCQGHTLGLPMTDCLKQHLRIPPQFNHNQVVLPEKRKLQFESSSKGDSFQSHPETQNAPPCKRFSDPTFLRLCLFKKHRRGLGGGSNQISMNKILDLMSLRPFRMARIH